MRQICADIESDHNSLTEILKFRRKQVTNRNKIKIYDISPLIIEKHKKLKNDKHIKFDNNNESENIEDH